MAQQMMWDPILSNYRAQASDGTVVTVAQAVMELATNKAGKTAYDSDWWVETVQSTLEHWGIYAKRWLDTSTKVPRVDFALVEGKSAVTDVPGQADPNAPTEQPAKPITSGPLTARIMSGPLNTKNQGKDRNR